MSVLQDVLELDGGNREVLVFLGPLMLTTRAAPTATAFKNFMFSPLLLNRKPFSGCERPTCGEPNSTPGYLRLEAASTPSIAWLSAGDSGVASLSK